MKSLFDEEFATHNIEEIRNGNFAFFKNGALLNNDNISTINKFYPILYNKWDRMPFYHCVPGINTITNDNKFKFMVVDMGDDEVFFSYKVVQIVTTKQIRIFDKVVSKNNIFLNEKYVTEELIKKTFVKFVFSKNIVHLIPRFATPTHLVEYNNYYYTRESFFNRLTTKKIRHWGCGLCNGDGGYVVVKQLCKKEDGMEIRGEFNKYLKLCGHKINLNDDKIYKKIIFSTNVNVKKLPFIKMED